ncbi:hypothetical protein CUMW_212570 [Citrus unshiu]|uniref:Uncharacterized protein n=1 Tax=Citrus unshiu TaxID=55188 RepID=A0A2H5QAU8_CITUN|nr:hypothetical protein CUMW_212570 [Citrus unshiu]
MKPFVREVVKKTYNEVPVCFLNVDLVYPDDLFMFLLNGSMVSFIANLISIDYSYSLLLHFFVILIVDICSVRKLNFLPRSFQVICQATNQYKN